MIPALGWDIEARNARKVRHEHLILGIPGLGLFTIAIALALGGGARPVRCAVVYGGPTGQAGPWHGRIAVFEVQPGDDSRTLVPHQEVELIRRGPVREYRVRAKTSSDGWLDVSLPALGTDSLDLVVLDPKTSEVLARGQPTLPLARWRTAPRRGLEPAISERFFGAQIERAVLVPSFFGKVSLRSCGGEAEIGLLGGKLGMERGEAISKGDGGARVVIPGSPGGQTSFWVRPEGHVVELTVACGVPRSEKTFHLPVVPGALFIEVEGHQAKVRSARGLPSAYFTWVTLDAREESGRLLLQPSKDGTSEGELPLKADLGGRYLVLSSSADGRSPSTLGYPMDGQTQTFDAVDGFLLDGSSEALSRERERAKRVTRSLLGYVAALFSLAWVLFRLLVANSDRQLLETLREHGAEQRLTAPLPRLPILVSGLTVALGLSLVVIWIAL